MTEEKERRGYMNEFVDATNPHIADNPRREAQKEFIKRLREMSDPTEREVAAEGLIGFLWGYRISHSQRVKQDG